PVPLGRPAGREPGRELLDDPGDRPGRQAARVEVLRRPAGPGPRRAGAYAGLRANDAGGTGRTRPSWSKRRHARRREPPPRVSPTPLPRRADPQTPVSKKDEERKESIVILSRSSPRG